MNTKTTFLISALAAASISSVSAATVAYWEFDNGDILDNATGTTTYDLTQSGSGYTGSATNLVSPVPNPDASAGAVNGGSISSTGAGSSYFAAGAGSRSALNLNGTSWTFEGWLNTPSIVAFDPIVNTRGGAGGDGILFDVRTVSSQQVFNLFIDARGGTGSGSAAGSASDTVFQDVLAPVGSTFHFALTYDGSNDFELFVDGVSKGTHTTALNLSHVDSGDTTVFELLGRSGDTDGSLGGTADEFRLSDTVLTSSQFLNAVAVPEPSAAALIGLAGFGLLLRRRRN